jgi:hypothetical protein
MLDRDDEAITLLNEAKCLNDDYFGTASMPSANIHELLTRAYFNKDDFRNAIAAQQFVYKFYKTHLGEKDEKTKQSSKILQSLTARAVEVAKKERLAQKNIKSKTEIVSQ